MSRVRTVRVVRPGRTRVQCFDDGCPDQAMVDGSRQTFCSDRCMDAYASAEGIPSDDIYCPTCDRLSYFHDGACIRCGEAPR